MTTATLQLKVQRSRFARHAFFALVQALPGRLRQLVLAPPARRVRSRSERAALEAREVREMAYAYSRTDPGFSSDLYAAAARHEGQFAD